MTRMEIWLPIRGFDGYEVSDLGRVRSWNAIGPKVGDGRRAVPLVLKPNIRSKKSAYLRVCIYSGGKRVSRNVHSLVLEAFVGPRPKGLIGLHRNGDKHTNAALNLRWGTYKENADDRTAHGRTMFGAINHKAKLTEMLVREIISTYAAGRANQVELARKFGVTQAQISSIIRGKTWRHLDRIAA